jgi:hypothetical protein
VLEYVGNIEWPGFCRKIIKRHFGLTLSLSGLHHIYERRRMLTVVVGVVLPLLSRDIPFGNAWEEREERPSQMVTNVREESMRESLHHI